MAEVIPIIDLIPFRLNNIEDFVASDHPVINPETNEKQYYEYWEGVLDKMIHGMWGRDYDKKTQKGGYRFMTNDLYHYIHNFHIRLKKKGSKIASLELPRLNDKEWFLSYSFATTDGFSGFEYDKECSSNYVLKKIQDGLELDDNDKLVIEEYEDYIRIKKTGKFKKYIDPRQYLYQTFNEPLGNPLYHNDNMNHFMFTTRRLGKSYFSISKGHRGIITRGASSIKEYYSQKTNFICVFGSSTEKYTTENYTKFKDAHTEMFEMGSFKNKQTGEVYPNPFWWPLGGKDKNGEFLNTLAKEYGGKKSVGATCQIGRFAFDKDESALVGPAPSYFMGEEVGTWRNMSPVHAKIEPALTRDGYKFASCNYIGTGGEIEYAIQMRPIFEDPSIINALAYPNVSHPGKKDTALFIPHQYILDRFRNENGNLDVVKAYNYCLKEREEAKAKGLQKFVEHTDQFPMIHDDVFRSSKKALLPIDKASATLSGLPSKEKRLYTWGKIERSGMKSRNVKIIKSPYDPILCKTDLTSANEDQLDGVVNIYEPPTPGCTYMTFYDSIKDEGSGSSKSLAATVKLFGSRKFLGNIVAESIYRRPKLDLGDDVPINMALLYGSKIFPELNIANIVSYTERIGFQDLLVPWAYEIMKTMGAKVQKSNFGYYLYPTMRKNFILPYMNELLLSVIESYEENGEKDILLVDEIPSELFLEEICSFDMAEHHNFDYMSTAFGWIIYIKQLIETDSYFPEINDQSNSLQQKLLTAINQTNRNSTYSPFLH